MSENTNTPNGDSKIENKDEIIACCADVSPDPREVNDKLLKSEQSATINLEANSIESIKIPTGNAGEPIKYDGTIEGRASALKELQQKMENIKKAFTEQKKALSAQDYIAYKQRKALEKEKSEKEGREE